MRTHVRSVKKPTKLATRVAYIAQKSAITKRAMPGAPRIAVSWTHQKIKELCWRKNKRTVLKVLDSCLLRLISALKYLNFWQAVVRSANFTLKKKKSKTPHFRMSLLGFLICKIKLPGKPFDGPPSQGFRYHLWQTPSSHVR